MILVFLTFDFPELTPDELADYSLGSKLQITAWYTYTALLWSLKGTMLSFFSRMTIGTWHKRMVNYISIGCVLSYIGVFLTVSCRQTGFTLLEY